MRIEDAEGPWDKIRSWRRKVGEKEEGGRKKMVREGLRRRVRTGGSLKVTKYLSDDGDTKVCPRRRAFLYLLDRVFDC